MSTLKTFLTIALAVLVASSGAYADDLDDVTLEEEIEAVRELHPEVDIEELDEDDDEDEDDGRMRGGAFNIQVLVLDKGLLEDTKRHIGSPARENLEMTDRTMFMLGGMTWSASENGLRVGTGTWAGYKIYRSDGYDVPWTDTATGDTGTARMATSVRVIPALAGGAVEKNWQFGPVGLFAGGMLGGGAYVIVKQTSRAGDIFADLAQDEADEVGEDVSAAVAPFIAGDVHLGASVRVTPALHIGVEFVTLFTYAPEGFVTGTAVEDFFTVAPGARLRVQFGRG